MFASNNPHLLTPLTFWPRQPVTSEIDHPPYFFAAPQAPNRVAPFCREPRLGIEWPPSVRKPASE